VEEPVNAAAPALVGWSQVSRLDGEPLEAWAEALRASRVPASAIDSLDVVYCQSWPYDDPPGRLADAVGADPKRLHYSGIGGTSPIVLLARAAERIAKGRTEVCAIVGGEALAKVRALKKQGERPRWSHRDPERKPFPFEAPFHPSEVAHQVFQAYSTFAVRDVARRAHRAEGVDEHRDRIGRLFAPMTEVAAKNPHAWFPFARSADELMTVTENNRVVAHPFTKLVAAMMDVDQAAAVVLASPAAADRLGVPADHRAHLRGWAADRDPDYLAEHDDLWRSPAMERALPGALARAGVGVDDVAHFDLYSCFPSSVSFSLDALGIDPDDARGPFTVTGGLPYAGGPGSCYALGSIAAMADVLVAEPATVGLVTAVGMHLSKHAAAVFSTGPGAVGPPPEPVAVDRRPIVAQVSGPATLAAYTVHHGSEGVPTDALLVCDVDGRDDGGRCYATATDGDLLAALEAGEWVGRAVQLSHADGVNVAMV
jgi:acetyl-CoA C-acetyltransferase